MGLIVSGRERTRCYGELLSCGRLTPFLSPPEQQQLGARLTLSIVNGLCLIFACLLIGYGVTGCPRATRQRMPLRAAPASTRVMVSLASCMPCSLLRDPPFRWCDADGPVAGFIKMGREKTVGHVTNAFALVISMGTIMLVVALAGLLGACCAR